MEQQRPAATLLDDRLEAKAASAARQVEASGATTSVSWNSLKGDFNDVFATAMDLLRHPAFSNDKLQLAKRRLEAGIARRNDDASGIAENGWLKLKLSMARDSPYARRAEYRDGRGSDVGRPEGMARPHCNSERHDRGCLRRTLTERPWSHFAQGPSSRCRSGNAAGNGEVGVSRADAWSLFR